MSKQMLAVFLTLVCLLGVVIGELHAIRVAVAGGCHPAFKTDFYPPKP